MGRLEEFGRRIDEEVAKLKRIHNLEDFGRRVEEELARVKAFVKEDVAPETEKRTAQFLREVSEKFGEAAGSQTRGRRRGDHLCPDDERTGRGCNLRHRAVHGRRVTPKSFYTAHVASRAGRNEQSGLGRCVRLRQN